MKERLGEIRSTDLGLIRYVAALVLFFLSETSMAIPEAGGVGYGQLFLGDSFKRVSATYKLKCDQKAISLSRVCYLKNREVARISNVSIVLSSVELTFQSDSIAQIRLWVEHNPSGENPEFNYEYLNEAGTGEMVKYLTMSYGVASSDLYYPVGWKRFGLGKHVERRMLRWNLPTAHLIATYELKRAGHPPHYEGRYSGILVTIRSNSLGGNEN